MSNEKVEKEKKTNPPRLAAVTAGTGRMIGHSFIRVLDALAKFIAEGLMMPVQAFSQTITELRPNYLILIGVMMTITYWCIQWVDCGEQLVITHPETGRLYVDSTATLVLGVVMLAFGILSAGAISLLTPPEPAKHTEAFTLQIVREMTQALAKSNSAMNQTAQPKDHNRQRKS